MNVGPGNALKNLKAIQESWPTDAGSSDRAARSEPASWHPPDRSSDRCARSHAVRARSQRSLRDPVPLRRLFHGPRTVPLALGALKELDRGGKKMKRMPVFRSALRATLQQNRTPATSTSHRVGQNKPPKWANPSCQSHGSPARLRKRRSKGTLGVATAILLQVDS
jgi:hypothetical protein